MERTQIQFTEDQLRRIRAFAHREGVSVAEMVRRCVDRFLDSESPDRRERYAAATALVGSFEDADGATDLAQRHDEYLEEAFR
jgi:hypothetical protein